MKRLSVILLSGIAAASLARAGQTDVSKFIGRETPPQVLEGTAKLVGHYDPTKMLRVVFALQPLHMAEEEQFLEELHTQSSPKFHHFLTAAEWNSRFAPSAADEQTVVDWVESVGFTVTHRYPNRLLVDVEAPVGTIEKALGVRINHYQVGGETLFSNDRDPVIPASLAGIIHSVQGLNNIQRMHPALRGTHDFPGPDYAPGPVVALGPHVQHDGDRTKLPRSMGGEAKDGPSITNGYYDPTDIYSSQAYDYNALHAVGHCCNPGGNPFVSPPDSSIAIAAFGVPSNSDIIGFQAQYPYLALWAADVFIDGAYQCATPTDDNCLEATLDTEWSVATSNSFDTLSDTAAVWLYAGANENNSTFTDVYNFMLTDGHARVFSTSWVCTEFYGCDSGTMDSRHAIFNSMLGQGWTLVAAAGDNGASADCYIDNPAHTSVDYPASDPDVVGAGGTTLDLNFDGTYNSEVAWQGGTYPGACFNNGGGTGGGFSAYYKAPIWMASGNRPVPDISLNASCAQLSLRAPCGNWQNIYYNGELFGDGGTSIVAPELAGFFAQENAYLLYLGDIVGLCHGAGPGGGDTLPCAPMGQANYYLWWVGYRPKEFSHYPFYNISSGCNSNDVTAADNLTYYCANPGYSLVTGWGTANMLQLAWAINEFLAGDGGHAAVNFSGPLTGQWYNYYPTVTWTLTNITGGFPANGFAGVSGAWDVDPGDSYSEPTPGGGNSFYSGPQFPHFTSGSLNLGGVAQGCHTANVRAWDNAGWGSGDQTFGPLCLDTIPPVISLALSPAPNAAGWFNSPVRVTLSASDPGASSNPATGSGVAATYYGVDAPGCMVENVGGCAVYSNSSPFPITTEGRHAVQYFTQDVAGNFSLAQPGIPINIDETPPHTRAMLTGNVRVGFIATDNLSGVASTVYQLDGGAVTTYTLPFMVSAKGFHTVTFHSTDQAGNVENTETVTFTVH
ncbi:MAG: protease pro-enzyme activation domain-containing protein [Terriglobia bacterium]